MIDPETKQVLCTALEMLKQQAVLSTRLLGWLVAVGDTVKDNTQLHKALEHNPSYYQSTTPLLHTTEVMIQNIDALIQQLKD